MSRHTLMSLVKFPFGIATAHKILQNTRPDVVISFGGYLSLPVAYATHSLSIPLVIHEQTLEAGFTNKVIAPFAKAICISWETSRKYFKRKNVVLTGNPLREDLIRPKTPEFARKLISELPTLYVTGGSAGSHAINVLLAECLDELLEKMIIVHQTGDARQFSDFERLTALRDNMEEKKASRYILRKFIDPSEVGYLYKDADVTLSRSGINTITELLWLGKPGLFIPLPFSQREEQKKNALFLKEMGLAEVLNQESTTPRKLTEKITSMLKNKKMYTISDNGKKYRKAIEEAADRIVKVAQAAAKKEDLTTSAA